MLQVPHRDEQQREAARRVTKWLREYPVSPDGYDLHDEVGRGTTAVVHRAVCKKFNEEVAVKLLDLEFLAEHDLLDGIVREAQLQRTLNHPHLLPLHCCFLVGSQLWMVMPFVRGGSLAALLKARHPQGLDDVMVATVMRPVLNALAYLHAHGIIHRDIKAGNVLVGGGGQVLLADYGVAKRLSPTHAAVRWGARARCMPTFVGTPCWMAPEVVAQAHDGYDVRADVWSFGITLIELAQGRPPNSHLSPDRILMAITNDPPPAISCAAPCSKHLADLVARCLAKDPAARPQAAALLDHKFFRLARDAGHLQEHLLGLEAVALERQPTMRGALEQVIGEGAGV